MKLYKDFSKKQRQVFDMFEQIYIETRIDTADYRDVLKLLCIKYKCDNIYVKMIRNWMVKSNDIKGEHMQDVIEAFDKRWLKKGEQ